MMRPIKFRGYYNFAGNALYPPDKRWIYGYYYLQDGKHWIKNIDDMSRTNAVEAGSVGQYTGLRDKNGVEIYEGDIVHLENHKHNHKIIYIVGSFVGKQTKGKFMGYLDGLFFYRTKVIGNKFEPPELLEK